MTGMSVCLWSVVFVWCVCHQFRSVGHVFGCAGCVPVSSMHPLWFPIAGMSLAHVSHFHRMSCMGCVSYGHRMSCMSSFLLCSSCFRVRWMRAGLLYPSLIVSHRWHVYRACIVLSSYVMSGTGRMVIVYVVCVHGVSSDLGSCSPAFPWT